jgi:hypothetical protein
VPDRNAATTSSGAARSALPDHAFAASHDAQVIHRFVHGLDAEVREMSAEEVERELNDPFALLLLREGVFPQTAADVLAGIAQAAPEGDPLRQQHTFLLGEGSQILFSEASAKVQRGLRLAITCGNDNEIDALVSTAPGGGFLQVMGWDKVNGVFHFYERKNEVWVWAGHSFHSLEEPSRSQGPFDSHVNGGMVMKELKFPWNNWRSDAATIPPEILAPEDPARQDPLLDFNNLGGAEFFEASVVRPGLQRWTDSRLAKTTAADGTVDKLPTLIRQLTDTTTVNLVSTGQTFPQLTPDASLSLPPSFFVDSDTFQLLGLPIPPNLSVPGSVYLDTLKQFEVALVDRDGGGNEVFRQPGDTHFAFLVPERAFEDVVVVNKLREVGLLSDRFLACVLMMDFSNPVFSTQRAALLPHFPASGKASANGGDLSEQVATAIEGAALDGSPEATFVANWKLGEEGWKEEFTKRLNDYYAALTTRLATPEGFADIFRLAESRRRQVRDLELSEGRPLLFADSNFAPPDPPLTMSPDGSIGGAA